MIYLAVVYLSIAWRPHLRSARMNEQQRDAIVAKILAEVLEKVSDLNAPLTILDFGEKGFVRSYYTPSPGAPAWEWWDCVKFTLQSPKDVDCGQIEKDVMALLPEHTHFYMLSADNTEASS